MSLSANIIDQRVISLAERFKGRLADELRIKDPERQCAAAFVLLAVHTYLAVAEDEALDLLTEGGNDFGVDAFQCASASDGEFTVTLFQGKYKSRRDGTAHFPRSGIEKMILAVGALFDPEVKLNLNPRLRARVEEARSLVRDGAIPQVRVVFCNNGGRWDDEGQQLIDAARLGNQVTWAHCNHESILDMIKATRPIQDSLQLSGRALVESFEFRRVLVGRIAVSEIAKLFTTHGDRLLQRNIRRYLGLQGNLVNEGIQRTLREPKEQPNFYFYNNGVTLTCDKFSHNELQAGSWSVRVTNMQVINGGQTCKTIERVIHSEDLEVSQASVMIRIYELAQADEELVRNITFATNSQNPVDLRDLMSNDEIQRRLELSIGELGYAYRRQRSESATKPTDLTSATAAEAILAVWREQPHQAKFRATEHFGRLYKTIFTEDLNGAQVITAVLLFRIAENRRKRASDDAPLFLHYASCFIAMEMGQRLLHELKLSRFQDLDHTNFARAGTLITARGDDLHAFARDRVELALKKLYGDQFADLKLQRLAGTFRRGDLIDELKTLRGHAHPELPVSSRPPKKPTAKKPAAKLPAAKLPAAKKPAAKLPAAKKPAAKLPAAKKPAAKPPAAKKPAAKLPAAKKPAAKKPAAKLPAAKPPAAKKPAAKPPAARKPAAKPPAAKKPAAKKPAAKKPAAK